MSDKGDGLELEKQEAIWLSNNAGDAPVDDKTLRNGFGLVLCKEFVEKHDGNIWVESRAGKGSDFKFTMPLYTSN